jgi:hypothetical protein
MKIWYLYTTVKLNRPKNWKYIPGKHLFKNIDDNLSNIEQMQLKDVIFASQKQNLCWNVIFNTLTMNKIDYVGYFQYVHYEIEYHLGFKWQWSKHCFFTLICD